MTPLIYQPPSVCGFMAKHVVFSTWMDHLCFAYDIVAALRPNLLVELGTLSGLSYFCFCQSVIENHVDARCFAVDTWEGDEHTGAYDDTHYRNVSRHNEQHYASMSTLLRMGFDDAVKRFDDESIQLLHIDGYHTYDAVRRDFETWYPKVAPGGVILFHDIRARMKDFGAWRVWQELQASHQSFTFDHGFGLGVLRKRGPSASRAPLLELLFESDPRDHAALRAFYVHASWHQDLLRKRAARVKRG
jgi:predicted O-methyltransferase YrrM